MTKMDYKAKVNHIYPQALCIKGEDNRFYVQNLPFGPDEGVSDSTATNAWKQAFWDMPVENRNKFVE